MGEITAEDRVVKAIVEYWRKQHGGSYDHHGVHILDHARRIREIVREATAAPAAPRAPPAPAAAPRVTGDG